MDSDGSGSSGSFAWGHTMTSHDSDTSDSAKSSHCRNNTIKEEDTNILSQNNESLINKRKRKLNSKTELSDTENMIHSPKKKKIERESREDTFKSKKKVKNSFTEALENNEDVTYDEDELNSKVKQEEDANESHNVSKPKKRKKRDDKDRHSSISELNITPTNSERKRKKSKSKILEIDADYDYLNQKVKQEINSDTPIVSKSKKNKRRERNELLNHSSVDEGDSYLDNNEGSEDVNNKKYNDVETDSILCSEQKYEIDVKDEMDTDYEFLNKKVKEEQELNQSIESQNSYSKLDFTSDNVQKEKKRKSKSSPIKKVNDANESFDIEDKFSAEETIVQKPVSNHKRDKLNNTENTDQESNDEQQENGYTDSNINDMTQQDDDDDKDESVKTRHRKSSTNSISSVPKITERIIYESDSDVNNVTNNDFKKLSRFLRKKSSLQPNRQELENEQKITVDDEIWIVKCPHNLDVVDFRNKDITIDHKSKMKVNGETYNGTLDETIVSAAITFGNIIKNVKINGVVALKRRLPKPQFVEDNVMIDNQTDFIPLPETKCRHPLFGSNYEKSIEMPMSVVQRLKDCQNRPPTEKKKKHKKECDIDDSPDNALESQSNHESELPRKKSKKRKLSNDLPTKKAKRIKKELDSSDVWESEKAIEENLFNF